MGGFVAKKVIEKVKPKSVEQPKVEAQMDAVKPMTTPDGPTSAEISDEQYGQNVKRRGRRSTILTSVTGVQSNPTLSKKTLLG